MPIKKSELYSSIWKSCDELRGGMDALQYKDYVLVLLFVKYVSDKYADQPGAPIEVPKGGRFAARRIWLNLELIKKPATCLEYVIVHEMVHLLERKHNDRFTSLMDQAMPQWRLHLEELNREPLGHVTWEY